MQLKHPNLAIAVSAIRREGLDRLMVVAESLVHDKIPDSKFLIKSGMSIGSTSL